MTIAVLLADHRLDQAMIAAEFLLRRGLHVATCTAGEQAKEAIHEHHADGEPYDLVIAHVDLPEIPGLKLLYDARRLHLDTLAGVVCGRKQRDEKTMAMAKKVNVSAILGEPYDLAELDQLARQILQVRGEAGEGTAGGTAGTGSRSAAPRVATPLPDPDTSSGTASSAARFRDEPDDEADQDDVALPSLGGDDAPVARPMDHDQSRYQRTQSNFYQADGTLDPTGHTSHTTGPIAKPLDASGGQSRRRSSEHELPGYQRQGSGVFDEELPQVAKPADQGQSKNYTRRRSSEFFEEQAKPREIASTRRVRRSLGGMPATTRQRVPDTSVSFPCSHCGKAITLKVANGPTDVPCIDCGTLNHYEP